jgi:hypothetical protein
MSKYPRSIDPAGGGRVHEFLAGRVVFAASAMSLCITLALLLAITLVLPAQLPVQNAALVPPQIASAHTIFVSNVGMLRGLSYATARALMIAGALYAGCIWEQKHQQQTASANPPQAQPPAGHPQERVVVVVLGDHLDRSERLLVELKHADAGSAELLSALRDEAKSLQAANRICRQNAAKDDDPALTTALDHLDRLLAELTNQPGGLNVATITRLQDEMNGECLLFEVRVLRSRIPDKQARKKSRSGEASI